MNTMLKYIIGSLLIVLAACNNKENQYALKKTKDIQLRLETAVQNISNISYYTEKNNHYITYVNSLNHFINFRNIHTDSIDFQISLKSLDSIQNTEDGIACFIHNRDSSFILLNERNTIYLINKNGDITSQWQVKRELENNNKEYVLQDVESMRLFYQNNKIYIQSVRNDIVMNSPENRKVFFDTPSEVIIHIDKAVPEITNKTGRWPHIYKTGKGYGDYWPSRCVNKKDEIIYAFAINDSLFVYKNDKLNAVINAGTKYPKNINPYPDDSTAHLSFLKKYNTTESRYRFILYNKYKNEYYRMFYKGEEKENEVGYKNRPWTLIALSSELSTVNETEFNSREYNWFSVLPSPEGLFICQTSLQDDPKNILRFGLFNLVKNEK
jgi:hypothetical protein